MPLITCPGCGAKIDTTTGEARPGDGPPAPTPTPTPLGETDGERADRLAREVETLTAQLRELGSRVGAEHEPPAAAARRRSLFRRD